MRSSISSSDALDDVTELRPQASRGAIAVLLTLIAVILASAEVFTRAHIVWMSKVEAREEREYRAAATATQANGLKPVLLMGNSLMGDGVRFEDVRAALAPALDVRRLYVDATAYLDFFYGIRRLYREGARYSAVAVFMTPRQLLVPGVRGDYFGYRLMAAPDIMGVARDAGLHRTTASNMLFANFSAFYGLRSETRKVLLGRLLPGLPGLMHLIANDHGRRLTDEEIYRTALVRLRGYRQLADAQSLRILLVLPPQVKPEGVDATLRAAAQVGVTVVTVPPEVTSPADFRDGFHLNAVGARKYTAALIPALAQALR